MEIDPEFLISEVFSHPPLWNQQHKSYRNRIIVEKLWKEVASNMNVTSEQAKKKWKYLRDQFRIEWRKIPAAKSGEARLSNAEYDSYTGWSHFKSMLFLKDSIRQRKTSFSSLGTNPQKNTDSKEDLATTVKYSNKNATQQIGEDIDLLVGMPTSTKRFRKHLNEETETIDSKNKKLKLLELKVNEKHERDEDEAFFDSLLPHVRKLSPEMKMLCRMEIQNAVFNYVYSNKYQHVNNEIKPELD
ncbi:transcription factor Adf-1-like [Malaya genurostris]|uniref:transcription factor Adf-1-like n=1 Tax=Malaya genurostris TaxID=325434 RepID=UPI0026F3C781|nr:transcription factor Adf-1-like [Malaya genurostris]XP_058457985.1 transcription factor Adf-1-like [Malaya genurostris]